ncbi:MAG: PadR family transcriptional regulator [Candidatus Kerfeldbacteria bacterium]|nr:PadR family transcriptional regulator [Candidatus Kerfeldbacteria bacterium]
MKKENKTQYVLLGLLNIHPQSGYDLKNNIQKTVGYFWSESYGQIYPTLAQLEKVGLVSKTVQKSGRQRQIYSITAKGRKILKQWLQTPITLPKIRNELLLKVFFASSIPTEVSIKHIAAYMEQTQQLHGILKQIEKIILQHPQYNPKKPYNLLTVQFGILATGAEMTWCKQALKKLQSI